MNEVPAEPIAQATEDVTDVTENVESNDAPPVTELEEPVLYQASPTEPIEQVALIQDELISSPAVGLFTPIEDEFVPAAAVEQVTPVMDEGNPTESVEHVAAAKEDVDPAEAVMEVTPEHAEVGPL
jgi:hypothetical protein